MWVRDTLPVHLPNVRAIIYGYDTKLVNSRSFQSFGEIAGTLRDRLLPMAYSTASSRPLVFLAHSLGGIVLKKTLIMLADSGPEGTRLLNRIYGGSMTSYSPYSGIYANFRSFIRCSKSRNGPRSTLDRCSWTAKPRPCDQPSEGVKVSGCVGQIVLRYWKYLQDEFQLGL